MLSAVRRHWRVVQIPTTPPIGNAISGSIVMPAIGRRASSAITTNGPAIDAQNEGSDSSFEPTSADPSMIASRSLGISGMIR